MKQGSPSSPNIRRFKNRYGNEPAMPPSDGEQMSDEDYADQDRPLLPDSPATRQLQSHPPKGKDQLRRGTAGDAGRPSKESITNPLGHAVGCKLNAITRCTLKVWFFRLGKFSIRKWGQTRRIFESRRDMLWHPAAAPRPSTINRLVPWPLMGTSAVADRPVLSHDKGNVRTNARFVRRQRERPCRHSNASLTRSVG